MDVAQTVAYLISALCFTLWALLNDEEQETPLTVHFPAAPAPKPRMLTPEEQWMMSQMQQQQQSALYQMGLQQYQGLQASLYPSAFAQQYAAGLSGSNRAFATGLGLGLGGVCGLRGLGGAF